MKTWCAVITRANLITFSLLLRVSEKTLMLFIPCRSLTQNLHNSGIYVRTYVRPSVQYIMMIFCTSRYNHCFEPMVPPPITWSELLPSLTVYSWVHLASLVPSALPHCWLGKLGLLDPRNTLVWPWTNLWSPLFWSHTGSIHGLPNNEVALQFILKRGISTF